MDTSLGVFLRTTASALLFVLSIPAGDVDRPPPAIFGTWVGPNTNCSSASGHPCPDTAPDAIRVTRQKGNKVGIAVKLHFENGQTCQLDKTGEWLHDHVVVRAGGINPGEQCELKAMFQGGGVQLSDEGQRCSRVYCGTRGTFDGVSLPRRSH
ncbi:MAG: hypothetical protein ABSF98_28005 [Bryobacteraceae bacterium]